MPFTSWNSFTRFRNRAIFENRFVRNDDDRQFLEAVVETSEKRSFVIKKGEKVWRAQRDNEWRTIESDPGNETEIPIPCGINRMIPKPEFASDGRVNPAGIPVLYTSNMKVTAISEVRPWIGSLVTLALFILKRDLRFVNCSEGHDDDMLKHIHLGTTTPDQIENAVWFWMNREFSTPLLKDDDKRFYVPTQIISEEFKAAGFDGIVYKSNFGTDGYNLAIFSVDDARCVETRIHTVTGITVEEKEEDKTARHYLKDDKK